MWGIEINLLQIKHYNFIRELTSYSFLEEDINDDLNEEFNYSSNENTIKDNSKIEIQFHEMYKKYFKMLAVGVPKENIRDKMKMDNIDASFIDYSPNYLIQKDINEDNSNNVDINKNNLSIENLLNTQHLKLKKSDLNINDKINNKLDKFYKKSIFSLEDILKKIRNLNKTNIKLI
jgi:hypothetical protein